MSSSDNIMEKSLPLFFNLTIFTTVTLHILIWIVLMVSYLLGNHLYATYCNLQSHHKTSKIFAQPRWRKRLEYIFIRFLVKIKQVQSSPDNISSSRKAHKVLSFHFRHRQIMERHSQLFSLYFVLYAQCLHINFIWPIIYL